MKTMLNRIAGVPRYRLNRQEAELIWTLALLLLLPIFLPGCVSPAKGPRFQAVEIPEGRGVIYLYQRKGPTSVSRAVMVNDKPVIVMGVNGYHPYIAHPGRYVIAASQSKPNPITIDVENGKAYYVKCEYSWSMGAPPMRFKVVPQEVGQAEIVKCKLLEE